MIDGSGVNILINNLLEDFDIVGFGYYGLVFWMNKNWVLLNCLMYFSLWVCCGIIFDCMVIVILNVVGCILVFISGKVLEIKFLFGGDILLGLFDGDIFVCIVFLLLIVGEVVV